MLSVKEHYPLQALNTLALDVKARYYVDLYQIADLPEVFHYAQQRKLDVLLLGGGSNLVLIDDFDGLVVHIALLGITIVKSTGTDVLVTAKAGENWHHLVEYCLANNYYGLENLVLIPGSVGAAPIQNIGAYGVELSNVFESLQAWDTQEQRWVIFSCQDCRFSYRTSIFKSSLRHRFIIIQVTLRLTTMPDSVNTDYPALKQCLDQRGFDHPTPQQIADAVSDIRRSKLPDPSVLPNVGSFFTNPLVSKPHYQQLRRRYGDVVGYPQENGAMKLAAAWLLEKAGWKGKRVGRVGLHAHQPLVLINYGGAHGHELIALAEAIKDDIWHRFSVQLAIEPSVVVGNKYANSH